MEEQKEQSTGMPAVKLDSGLHYSTPFNTLTFVKLQQQLAQGNAVLKHQALHELLEQLKRSPQSCQQAIQDGVFAELVICLTEKSASSTTTGGNHQDLVMTRQFATQALEYLTRTRSAREFAIVAKLIDAMQQALLESQSSATRRSALGILANLIQSPTGIQQLLEHDALFGQCLIARLQPAAAVAAAATATATAAAAQGEPVDAVRTELCALLSTVVRHPRGYEQAIKCDIVKALSDAIGQLTSDNYASSATSPENNATTQSRLLAAICRLISHCAIHPMGKQLFCTAQQRCVASLCACLQQASIVNAKFGDEVRLHAASALVNLTVDKSGKLQAIQAGCIESVTQLCLASSSSSTQTNNTAPAVAPVNNETKSPSESPIAPRAPPASADLLVCCMQIMSNVSEHPESKKRASGALRHDAVLDWLRAQKDASSHQGNTTLSSTAESTYLKLTWRP